MLRGPTVALSALRIIGMTRILHRVEVIQVPEEFIEAVDRGQELVQIAQVILPELAGRIAHRLQHRRDRGCLFRHADRRPRLPDCRQTGADRDLAGDEVGASRRAARLGVVVGEARALGRKRSRFGVRSP